MKAATDPYLHEMRGNNASSEFTRVFAYLEFPQYFIKPESVYMASVIKELLEQDHKILAFVGSHHYHMIK